MNGLVVEIPKETGGSALLEINAIELVESNAAGMTVVKCHTGHTVNSSLSVGRIHNRIQRASEAFEKVVQERLRAGADD